MAVGRNRVLVVISVSVVVVANLISPLHCFTPAATSSVLLKHAAGPTAALLSRRALSSRRFLSEPKEIRPNDEDTHSSSSSSTTTITTSSPVNNSNSNNNKMMDAVELRAQAKRIRLEAEQMEALLTLEKVAVLEKKIQKSKVKSTGGKDVDTREDLLQQIEILARKMDPTFVPRSVTPDTNISTANKNNSKEGIISSNSLNPSSPTQLTPTELLEASSAFMKLPAQVRISLAKVAGVDIRTSAISKQSTEEIVTKLNEQYSYLLDNPQRLTLMYRLILQQQSDGGFEPSNSTISDINDTKKALDEEEMMYDDLYNLLSDMDVTETGRVGRFMESAFPKQTRKPDMAPTLDDAQLFTSQALDVKSVFNPTAKPEEVPGGFIIRGNNRMTDAASMVQAIDAKFQTIEDGRLADQFNFYYVEDPTPEAMEDMDNFFGQPVLLFTGRDLSPTTNTLVLSLVSSISLILVFLFTLGTFASNDLIMNRMTEANAVGDYDTQWFNELIVPTLAALAGTQLVHELAHFAVAKFNNFKMAPPTVLPSVTLPSFGCSTAIKSSPPNRSALFDFAAAGPTMGLLSSSALLFWGTQQGLSTTDISYFPSLPVEFLQLSSLAGSVVDAALGGVLTTNYTPEDVTAVQIHPLAVAGYCGVVINALNLLPLGSTDGGRISQTIFGRSGHSVIQGFVYLTMFGASLLGHDKSNILVAYALFCIFGQGEMEIPCRNEVDNVPIPRVFAALALWFVVALTLIPLQ